MLICRHCGLVRFVEDQVVFRATARYDGMPIFGEGFVLININNAEPATSVLFPQDIANTVATPKALPIAGDFSGTTQVFLECATPGAEIHYTDDESEPKKSSKKYNGPITLSTTKTIKAIGVKPGMTDSTVLSATYTKV